MDAEQIRAFRNTARRFADNEVRPIFQEEGRDGDLEMIPEILAKAKKAGIMATGIPDDPGFDYGVWGRACLAEGASASLAVLEELGHGCAGVAACVHFAGLGALEARENDPVGAVAFFENEWRIDHSTIKTPPENVSRLNKNVLNGTKNFVHMPPGCEGFIVYASSDSGWVRIFLPKKTEGLSLTDCGERMGLAALDVAHLECINIQVKPDQMLNPVSPAGFLKRNMLGLAAVSVGNARAALDAAKAYAAERYQGCGQIDEHAAVRILIGDSVSRIQMCGTLIERIAMDETITMLQAFGAKLRITLECAQGVTDCLQVLGGYGYMEDYGQEKRLRDALTLKSMAIKPDLLRMLCASVEMGGDG